MSAPISATTPVGSAIQPVWYGASIREFAESRTDAIVGRLVTSCGFAVEPDQTAAWLTEIDVLRSHLAEIDGSLFFEFSIPRMGRRIDVVLLIKSVVFVLEFKVGAREFDRAAIEQVWDYALDLKNFHEASHHCRIVPLLVATEARDCGSFDVRVDSDGVVRPLRVTPSKLREAIELVLSRFDGPAIDADEWLRSAYRPTPTIIEAARALYAQHSVEAIARHDAGALNLRVTSQRIEELVEESKRSRQKVICFVTGVPGAGKTLVGLNVATQRREHDASSPAVYLSGNGPLVAVLREALTRDEVSRGKSRGEKVRKGKVAESVKAFIQNVHHYRDWAVSDRRAPVEHVAIFDEAQRAWTQRKAESFMRRRKGLASFSQSEPEFLISTIDRHLDWGVVVCLVGGGQEIHDGEAGIDEWLRAINQHFPEWRMHISSRLTDSEYASGYAVDTVKDRSGTSFDDSLHLAVSMRSFRAENVSAFVKAVLDRELSAARSAFEQLCSRYPIVITRDLDLAKDWTRDHARGSERYGLLASSKAMRLKPHAIDVRVDVDPVKWFLNDRDDVRSSYYLEDAATEFQVQGLEVDWAVVNWDADLRTNAHGWSYHDFRGDRWQNVKNTDNRRYLLNAYRVLLTRARQGMAIFVPPGNRHDPTRSPEFYDGTFETLRSIGIAALQ